jgi:hypothetical protein
MKTQLLGALLALSLTTPALAAIKEEPVTYKDGETTMKGVVVYDTMPRAPSSPSSRPSIPRASGRSATASAARWC